jgi:hypothetical protein
MTHVPSILIHVTIGKSDKFLTLSREIIQLSQNRIPSLALGGKWSAMELPPDSHRVLPIKRLTALLVAASHRADFSYLLPGCLPVELCGSAVIKPQ